MDKLKWRPTAGNVLLKMDELKDSEIAGMITAYNKRKPYDTGTVVAIGSSDMFEIDELVEVGAKFVIPATSKQELKLEGDTYYVIHHRELKIRED